MAEKRVVCINCIDGRVQTPVIQWIQDTYQIDYVDMITEPGVDGLLANDKNSVDDIYRKVKLSIAKNNSSMIFIAGHHDCQGNAVSDSDHKEHIRLANSRLKKDFPDTPSTGLWINEHWQVEKLS